MTQQALKAAYNRERSINGKLGRDVIELQKEKQELRSELAKANYQCVEKVKHIRAMDKACNDFQGRIDRHNAQPWWNKLWYVLRTGGRI